MIAPEGLMQQLHVHRMHAAAEVIHPLGPLQRLTFLDQRTDRPPCIQPHLSQFTMRADLGVMIAVQPGVMREVTALDRSRARRRCARSSAR